MERFLGSGADILPGAESGVSKQITRSEHVPGEIHTVLSIGIIPAAADCVVESV